MRARALAPLIAGVFSAFPCSLSSQTPVDPEVVAGIRQVEDGDHDVAILTLDAATRRLAARRPPAPELAQAYLYLGIAYVAKGHETLARAKFREALARDREMAVNPEKFSPKVLELIEQARREASAGKGGSKKGLLLLGVGGAAAAGIAVASSGGGGGSATTDSRRTQSFGGFVALDQGNPQHALGVTSSGLLEAELSWPEPGALLHLYLFDASTPRPPFNDLASSASASGSPQRISFNITPGNYVVGVGQRVARNGFAPPLSTAGATYALRVTHP